MYLPFAFCFPDLTLPSSCLTDGIRQLDLSIFEPGSLIYKNGKLSKVCDPLRRPGDLLSALMSPIGSFLDKLKVARLLLFSFTTSVDQIFDEKETSTLEALRNRWQFSEEFIDEFYRPFLGGIYLSELSDQSSRMFQFIFKMFAQGSATLPKFGGIAKVGEVLFESTVKEFAKSANNFEIAFDSEVTNVEVSEKMSWSCIMLVEGTNCVPFPV